MRLCSLARGLSNGHGAELKYRAAEKKKPSAVAISITVMRNAEIKRAWTASFTKSAALEQAIADVAVTAGSYWKWDTKSLRNIRSHVSHQSRVCQQPGL